MLPLLALEKILGNIGQILLLGAAVLVGLWALSQAGMLIEGIVALVEFLIQDIGGAVGQLVLDLLAAIVESIGSDVIGV